MVGPLMPAVQAAREAACRMCRGNNLRQIGRRTRNYHAAFNQMPSQNSGPYRIGHRENGQYTNSAHSSHRIFVGMLPFMKQQALRAQTSAPLTVGTLVAPAFGPSPDTDGPGTVIGGRTYTAYPTDVPILRCPSHPGVGLPAQGRTNDAVSLRDGIDRLYSDEKGMGVVLS